MSAGRSWASPQTPFRVALKSGQLATAGRGGPPKEPKGAAVHLRLPGRRVSSIASVIRVGDDQWWLSAVGRRNCVVDDLDLPGRVTVPTGTRRSAGGDSPRPGRPCAIPFQTALVRVGSHESSHLVVSFDDGALLIWLHPRAGVVWPDPRLGAARRGTLGAPLPRVVTEDYPLKVGQPYFRTLVAAAERLVRNPPTADVPTNAEIVDRLGGHPSQSAITRHLELVADKLQVPMDRDEVVLEAVCRGLVRREHLILVGEPFRVLVAAAENRIRGTEQPSHDEIAIRLGGDMNPSKVWFALAGFAELFDLPRRDDAALSAFAVRSGLVGYAQLSVLDR